MSELPPSSNWIRWFFADQATGRIVIAQWPNLQLWIFIVAWPPSRLLAGTTLGTAAAVVAALALTIWALDELLRGQSPFRRCLGLGVLAYNVWAWS